MTWPAASVSLALALSLAVPVGAGAAAMAATPFAAPPAASAQRALSEAERDAGVVVLTHEMHIEAFARDGEEYTEEFHHLRYLVLDAMGAAEVSQHVFFSADDESYEVLSLEGQTIADDGTVIPLDEQRDVQLLDARDGTGLSTLSLRSVNFPRVAPGAILDLAYRTRVDGIQPIKLVRLERDYPTRDLTLRIRMVSDDDRRWVPTRIGSLPPSATATLTSQMELLLEAQDVPAKRVEPFAPPDVRRGLALALTLEEVPQGAWQDHLLLWAGQPPQITGDQATGRLGAPAMALDGWGLQQSPAAAELAEVERLIRDHLGEALKSERRFLGRTRRAEDTRTVAQLAPPNLPWHERAERLFDHARSRLRVDTASSNTTLDRALRSGYAGPGEVTLYYQYLLDKAGIRNRQALLLSRNGLPFSPALGALAPYDPLYVVEAGPEDAPRYYPVGDPVANARGVPDPYFGALAFVRERNGDRWAPKRVPVSSPIHELTVIEFTSDIAPSGEATDLTMRMFLEDAAARSARSTLRLRGGGVYAGSEAATDYARDMLSAWVGLDPEPDPKISSDTMISPLEPLPFVIESQWQPRVQNLDGRLLVRALPDSWRTSNPFTATSRSLPLWLAGGDYDLRMRWRLPPGYAYAGESISEHVTGPAGLEFTFTVETETTPNGEFLTSSLVLSEPYIIDAADYTDVQRFFERLQRTVDRRKLLLVPNP
ncbi:MAG: DUF3857 domain-containing protein [Pseudomonadota bacterium]